MTNPPASGAPSTPPPPIPQADRSVWGYIQRAPITFGLLGFTVFVFVLQAIYGAGFVDLLIKNNDALRAGQYWRFLTPVFLHGNEIHLLVNMYALFQIGPIVEREFGRFRFLAIYLLSGIAGVILSLSFTSADSLGASGAIFGLIGAWGVFLFMHRKLLGPSGRSALSNVLFIIVLNVGISFFPGIDLWGHFGGLLTGAIIAWLAGPLFQVQLNPASEKPQLVDVQSFSHTQIRVASISLAIVLAALLALRGGV